MQMSRGIYLLNISNFAKCLAGGKAESVVNQTAIFYKKKD